MSVELGTDNNELDSMYELFEFEKECTKPGMMCKSCKKLVMCIESEGKYEEMDLQTCSKEQTCLNNECSEDPNPLCHTGDQGSFMCTATAMFPDPYNCNIYHICAKKSEAVNDNRDESNVDYYHAAMKCDDDYGYDPVSTYCKNPLKNNACPDKLPVPTCQKLGQSGALINPSIYYICRLTDSNTLEPELGLCPHGKKFIGGRCY